MRANIVNHNLNNNQIRDFHIKVEILLSMCHIYYITITILKFSCKNLKIKLQNIKDHPNKLIYIKVFRDN